MPIFPSKEWCEELVRLLNGDAERAQAMQGWQGDVGVVVEAEPGKLAKPFVVYAAPSEEGVRSLRVLVDPDDLEELSPAYLARAPYTVWKHLLRGTLDPVEAVLMRQLRVEGDVQPVMERLRYRGVADRVLERLETLFVDEH